jgi:hypothetical protein
MNMRKLNLNQISFFFLLALAIFITGCSKKSEKQAVSDIWDIDKDGIPKFVKTNYIELAKIYRISKFRSSYGHDYSDAFEDCRSMKHYFEPRSDVDWTTVKIYSPVTGVITRVEEEWAGTKIEIASDDYPAFRFTIFHISTLVERHIDEKVVAGEQLGTHIGSQTMSDISVIVNDPTKQGRMISYFEVITNAVFNEYSNRGVSTRADMIITKTTRDADPLTCSGETFITTGSLENWVNLN